MRLQPRKPAQALDKAYAKQSIPHQHFDRFRQALLRLLARLDEGESEVYQRKIITEFLNSTFYDADSGLAVASRDQNDLVIYTGPEASPGVLIAAKKVFAGEMMTMLKNNVKSLHELILYYFEEAERRPDRPFTRLVITDVYNWFFFAEADFRRFFYQNPRLRKLYQVKRQQQKDNAFFFSEAARILRDMDDEVPVTWLNLRELENAARTDNPADWLPLIPVYKLFSPEHLLQLPPTDNGDGINKLFVDELLHVLGLQRTVSGGIPRLERLPEPDRQPGSWLENIVACLRTTGALAHLPDPLLYGPDPEGQETRVALELLFTWLGRVLFLKRLEGQLQTYQGYNREGVFLTPRQLRTFAELGELFFDVIAVPVSERSAGVMSRYGSDATVPYLNSALFEPTPLEQRVLRVSALNDRLALPLFDQTILKTPSGDQQTGELPTLTYLLALLDSYDFATEGAATIQIDNKPPLSHTALGLVLDLLSNARTGAAYTPGWVAVEAVREPIRRLVVQRFNERFGLSCSDLTDLRTQLQTVEPGEANALINSLRVVDPAVGGGHLLVSALHELIAIKAELGILTDPAGRLLSGYTVSVEQDDLVVWTADGEVFAYQPTTAQSRLGAGQPVERASAGRRRTPAASEKQRVQETLFAEKLVLIQNCLVGVDSDPLAVSMARLRLGLELLKSTYYATGGKAGWLLPNLPNLDANLKVGHALIGQLGLGFRPDAVRNVSLREKFAGAFRQYRADRLAYPPCREEAEKAQLQARMADFEALLPQLALIDRKDYAEIRELETRRAQLALTFDFVENDNRLQTLDDQLVARKKALADKQRPYEQAVEWRFMFPEVLDEAGVFVGFDAVLSRPPITGPDEPSGRRAVLSKSFPNTYTLGIGAYGLFVEQGLNLLRPGGQLACVLPTDWMRSPHGANLRHWLKTGVAIEQVTDLGDDPAGEGPVCVLHLRKAPAVGSFRVAQRRALPPHTSESDTRSFVIPTDSLPDDGWLLSDPTGQNLLTRIRQAGQPLTNYVAGRLGSGIKTGLDEAFVVDAKIHNRLVAEDPRSAEVLKPVVLPRTIRGYTVDPPTRFLIALERGLTTQLRGETEPETWLAETYPAVYNWLKPFAAKAQARVSQGVFWWELQTDAAVAQFRQPYIVFNPAVPAPVFALADANTYPLDKTFVIGSGDRYLLAVLNSAVVGYFLRVTAPVTPKGPARSRPDRWAQIPIPSATPEQQASVVALVDQILSLRAAGNSTEGLEAEVSTLVGALYGLSPDEMASIHPADRGETIG
ncbi:class I SAM-dependent DNA methyltransferase [Rudanella paleaurantiibacter]|uniref:site-specific DNA-methyltransferase (adenine-specific) n=1 Tax=Rudanella paleaurantiibacter TaxID=2614655 RepID=A0A7J5TVM6_9BACT|nr:class I SAM-dependent DNA methyltransferase [Rudanella paleaurantiibacter]KAB7728354.1 class I SAM-dependent DNA methyltransferase [Rudanella paleaurantiibacter]